MDHTSTIKQAFDKVTKRQKLYNLISKVVMDRVCEVTVETLMQILLNNNETEHISIFAKLKLKLDSLLSIIKLQGLQKDMNTSSWKFEKVLDNSYHPDIYIACRSIDFDTHLMDKMLVEYFHRKGLFGIGDCLVKEAKVEVEKDVRSQFLEFQEIKESMRLRNIEPAMRWVSENREKLNQKGSEIALKLICFKYCDMLRRGESNDAVKYARTHFPQYYPHNIEVLQKLLAALLWVGKLDKSPYAEMVSSFDWDKTTKELTKEYYHLLGQPYDSLLKVVLTAGFESLPTLLKLIQVMEVKIKEWEEMKKLPVSVELGNEFQFHSVFVCPVSRDESNEENPPMMMPCQHVLCKESIMRLSKNSGSYSLKCPYCHVQTSLAACRQLYF
ncbi:unnamed protein product [Cochlearia groenlandica]